MLFETLQGCESRTFRVLAVKTYVYQNTARRPGRIWSCTLSSATDRLDMGFSSARDNPPLLTMTGLPIVPPEVIVPLSLPEHGVCLARITGQCHQSQYDADYSSQSMGRVTRVDSGIGCGDNPGNPRGIGAGN